MNKAKQKSNAKKQIKLTKAAAKTRRKLVQRTIITKSKNKPKIAPWLTKAAATWNERHRTKRVLSVAPLLKTKAVI